MVLRRAEPSFEFIRNFDAAPDTQRIAEINLFQNEPIEAIPLDADHRVQQAIATGDYSHLATGEPTGPQFTLAPMLEPSTHRTVQCQIVDGSPDLPGK